MKKLTEIKNEKAVYFVCINGDNVIEADTLTECKNYLCKYLKEHKKEIEEDQNYYDYYIGMYSITIE